MLFDRGGGVVARAQRELTQHYPADGWVEHDPEEIWTSVPDLSREVMAVTAHRVAALGITNQRETTIVWQDRRTAGHCQTLMAAGHEALVTARTGLLLDPYFSASKIAWLLDHVPGARATAERGELAFGIIDRFPLWRVR